jgi:hypothetical protein
MLGVVEICSFLFFVGMEEEVLGGFKLPSWSTCSVWSLAGL